MSVQREIPVYWCHWQGLKKGSAGLFCSQFGKITVDFSWEKSNMKLET